MPDRRLVCAGLLAIAFIAGAARAADEHVALFKNVTGQVTIHRGEAALEAAPGATLLVSDRLVSAPASSAGIVFRDGTLMTLGPASELLLRDYAFEPQQEKYAFSAYLKKGSAVYSSGKLAKLAPDSVRIDTPTATIGVRGTRFIIEAE